MNEYSIVTDSGCDIEPQLLDEWEVKSVDFTFRDTATLQEYTNRTISVSDFYRLMRDGQTFHTSAANTASFRDLFKEELLNGRDIIYLCFSSGLSSTVNAAQLAAAELREEYPERRISVIDTLCASAGQGMLVYLSVLKKKAGVSLQELEDYIREVSPDMCHWFTVGDLTYLRRSGRMSTTAAFAANVLGIKPILHMDESGSLTCVSKVRGRKQAIRAIASKYISTAKDIANGIYFLCHSDCYDEALQLEQAIFEQTGKKAAMICSIGPVIGCHCGPGTLAVEFFGKHR